MFITFEGPEGSGKTTQIRALQAHLQSLGVRVCTTREPGGTTISDQIRAILTSLENTAMHPRTEILLFLAARAQLVEEVIRPQLRAGNVVISDRYADSTLAYQGYGHGYDLDRLRLLLEFATDGLWPDLTLLLDIDPAIGLARKRHGGEWNRLDAYAEAFHHRVRTGYLELAARDPQRWVIIDASRPCEEVQAAIRRAVLARLQPS
ncbi:MAG TPA: dTMP kinase [Anaerolinea thermolimosa]|uniref:Thymidylate kinase n=1 Tax=Anaerolinea thermolimosa TaxID=229919 RepID=A0A3D1JEF6_9CHLR|nr:dTMP kinase [Anaerolinea thermolimosa]GAP08366.1 thymidylate kinase [Anaerolinea thermolimosa]HCE16949.1 dTMP kinase [Anaerolinea thermolimosa]